MTSVLLEQSQLDQGYGLTDKKFTEFLRTLGLRTHDEKDKKALGVIRDEASKRGW